MINVNIMNIKIPMRRFLGNMTLGSRRLGTNAEVKLYLARPGKDPLKLDQTIVDKTKRIKAGEYLQ